MAELELYKDYIIKNLNNQNIDCLNQYVEQAGHNLSINQAANQIMINSLPLIKKTVIKILEISSYSGSATQKAITKYQSSCLRIEATILFENQTALELSRIILNKYFPNTERLHLSLANNDYLLSNLGDFDIVIGTPLVSKLQGLKRRELCAQHKDYEACNTASFLIHKAINSTNHFAFLLPKYFLSNVDFLGIRNVLNKHTITHIYDFSEIAFQESHQEFIGITVSKSKSRNLTLVSSLADKKTYHQLQTHITENGLNFWTIYSTQEFRNWLKTMEFGLFDVYRDRQLKKSDFKKYGEIRVLKAVNIPRTNNDVLFTESDMFLEHTQLNGLAAAKFLNRTDVYLCPNLTAKPRLVEKPANTIASGSLAILIPKLDSTLKPNDIEYFSSAEFEKFYNIGRNLSKRSLNIDKQSVVLFGKKKTSTE